jgi:glycosyltransferase involved in cell wall biosynthesis
MGQKVSQSRETKRRHTRGAAVRGFMGILLRKVKSAIRWPGYVDREWYLKQYPDVRKSGLDPLDHYRWFGRREGRIPAPSFVGGSTNAIPPSGRVDADWEFLEKTTAAATSQLQTEGEEQFARPRPRDVIPDNAVIKARENGLSDALAGRATAMKIVIINHGSYDNNSAIHITGFANGLAALGHRIVVSAAGSSTDAGDFGIPRFRCVPHQSLRDNPEILTEYFGGSTAGPDLVHCWTPRRIVRDVAGAVIERYGCPYVVHLEDNEMAVAEAYESLGKPRKWRGMRALSPITAVDAFVRSAAGATIIVEALKEVLPDGMPCHLLQPGVDGNLFAPGLHGAERERLCDALAVPCDAWITVYPGNMHPANYEDMFSLYAAIHAINVRGHKMHLVRTGVDSAGFFEPRFLKLASRYVTNLGFVSRNWLIDLFKLADFFVQPGGPDKFNSYRLPSKLPELLAMGRPVVLPKTNIGLLMDDRVNALLMQRGDAAEIANCVEVLLKDSDLAERIGQAGRRFAIEHFSWERSAQQLEGFFRRILRR